jgi:thiol:disulfide interchange protein DsbD
MLFFAESSPGAETSIPHGTLDLVAENQWITTGHEFDLGLAFQLEKGWHIYWVNPGDSGEPPRITWHLPPGVTAGPIVWPTPRRLGTSSIVDFGYEDAVMLIVPMQTDASLTAERPAELSAEVSVLVCREMCIPGKAHVSLTLPVKLLSASPDTRASGLFAATRKSLPRRPPTTWKFRVDDARDSFVLSAKLGREITQATFFPLSESQVNNAAPQKLMPETGGFRLTLRKSDQLLKPIERLKGVVVLPANRAYLVDVPVNKPSA